MNKHNINNQHLIYQCLFHVGFNNIWLKNLDISYTNFKYLPNNLTVQGSLDIDQSSLMSTKLYGATKYHHKTYHHAPMHAESSPKPHKH